MSTITQQIKPLSSGKRWKGFLAAGGVAVLQGAEGIFFPLFGLVPVLAMSVDTVGLSVTSVVLRETIVFFLVTLLFFPQAREAVKEIRKHRNRARLLLVSGIFTAMGNTSYILGVAFAGATYGVILNAFYPVFVLFFLRMLFKEKQNWKVWTGVSFVLTSGALFVLLPSLISSNVEFTWKTYVGMAGGLLSAFFWSLEGIFIKKGSTGHGADRPRDVYSSTFFRTFSAWMTTLVVIFPISFAFGDSANIFATVFTSWQGMLIVWVIAVSSFVLRLIHVYAIFVIGPKLTAIIDNNNFLTPPFLIIFLQFAKLNNNATGEAIFIPFEWWNWLLTLPLITGVLLVVFYEPDRKDELALRAARER